MNLPAPAMDFQCLENILAPEYKITELAWLACSVLTVMMSGLYKL